MKTTYGFYERDKSGMFEIFHLESGQKLGTAASADRAAVLILSWEWSDHVRRMNEISVALEKLKAQVPDELPMAAKRLYKIRQGKRLAKATIRKLKVKK